MYYHLENKMTEANEQLGDFLRSRRERLTPERLGLQVLRRRRTPGLRREEVASAAGISGEWYVKLEQGRAVAPSPATIDALAKALLLDDVDHAHLKSLARPSHRRSFVRETVPDPVKRLVNSLEHPAYVTGQRWDVLAWNKAASSMLANFEELAMEDRNILLYVLTDPRAKTFSANDGTRRPCAWSPCSVPRTTFGPKTPRLPISYRDCALDVRGSMPGGRPMRLGLRSQERRQCTIPHEVRSATNT